MNENILKEFEKWCLTKAKISKGSTQLYVKYLMYTKNFTLKEDYSEIYRKIYGRVNSEPERYAHIKFLKFLKDKTTYFEEKKTAALIINEVGDITIGKSGRVIDHVREKVLTKEDLLKYYDYVKNLDFECKTTGGYLKLEKWEKMRNLLLIRCLFESAGRAEEVRKYQWDMVDYEKRIIKVPGKITKRNKPRQAEISDKTVRLLKVYHKELEIQGKMGLYIFTGFDKYTQVLRYIKRIGRRSLHKNVTPHCFRHTFCTLKVIAAIKNGENKAIIKEKLRDYLQHSTTLTTEIYIQIAEEFQRERILELYGEVI